MATMKDILRLSGLEEAQYDLSSDEVKLAGELLKKALRSTKLTANLRTGEERKADVGEFMLMGKSAGNYQFKHHESRNYLFVNASTGKLTVPKSDKAFFKGEFPDNLSDLLIVDDKMMKMLDELKRYTRRMERGLQSNEPRQIRPNAKHVIDMVNKILDALDKKTGYK